MIEQKLDGEVIICDCCGAEIDDAYRDPTGFNEQWCSDCVKEFYMDEYREYISGNKLEIYLKEY